MARVSPNFLLIFFVCVNLVASLSLLGFSLWLHFSNIPTPCFKVLEKPSLILGVIVLLFSVFGLVLIFSPGKFILGMCVILSFLLYSGLLCFVVFSILVTNRNVSRALFGRDGNYSDYLLENYVMNAAQIKSCLVEFEICPNIPTGEGAEFYKYSLSPTQLSCCKLHTDCRLEPQNATYWIMPKSGPAVANNDCKNWSTVQGERCFNCQSCKTEFFDIIKKYWKIFSFVIFLILFVSCVESCARRIKNRSKGHQRNKVYPV